MSSAAQESSAQSPRAERLQIQHVLDKLQGPLVVALCYFLGAQLAFYVGTLSDRVFALFWPPNVILFFALLIVPRRRWWLYIAVAFPAHAIAELGVGMPWSPLLLAYLTNCTVAALGAYLVSRCIGDRPWFGKFRNAAWYIVITAGITPAIAALGGAFVPILSGGKMSDYGAYWTHWYFANAIPNITLGPAFLTWYSAGTSSWRPSFRHMEPAVLIVALIVACAGGTHRRRPRDHVQLPSGTAAVALAVSAVGRGSLRSAGCEQRAVRRGDNLDLGDPARSRPIQ